MKTVLITGASRGIGRATAVRLAAAGRKLYLHGRSARDLEVTAAAVREREAEAVIVTGDLTSTIDLSNLASSIEEEHLDVLVHNAGIARGSRLADLKMDEWQQTVAINVSAPFLLTQLLLPKLIDGGSIVAILSMAAKRIFPGMHSYTMSKFALDGFMKSIREELREMGVRVINIYPAAAATEIWQGIPGDWPLDKMMSADEIAETIAFALSRPAGLQIDDITLSNFPGW